MAKASKFTDEQKFEIALDLLAGKMSHAEICRKWDISSTYAYKLKLTDGQFESVKIKVKSAKLWNPPAADD